MQIRDLTLNDDLNKVAELIYQTDPYIYPYWFKDYSDWKSVLKHLIKTDGTVFYYKNIIIAIEHDEVIGIVVVLDNNSNLDYDYSDLIKINKNFKYTISNYIKQIDSKTPDSVYIPNVCVDLIHRQKGVGFRLISYVKDKYKKNLLLDCLADNLPALKLYSKCNFKIAKEGKGFNAPYKKKPFILKMIYKHNKK